MNDRHLIRQTIRQKRRQLPASVRRNASIEICHYIANTLWFRRSQRIAFYLPIAGELDPAYLIQRAWQMGKTCYLPVCHPLHHASLLFVAYAPNDQLTLNRYGILEPSLKHRSACKPFALDLVFTPLLAFDAQGNRLGSGKGYYDRTFAYRRVFPTQLRPMLVGLAYTLQEVAQLPAQAWDIPLDKVIVVRA